MGTQTIMPSKVLFANTSEEDFESSQEKANEIRDTPLEKIAQRVQEKIPSLQKRDNFANSLARNCAGPEDIAATLGDILHNGQEHNRLRAAEIAMKSLGLLENQNMAQGSVTFQIQGDNINLQAVLQPERKQELENE